MGTIPPFVLPHLSNHPDVFDVVKKDDRSIGHVALATELKTFEDRTNRVDYVMQKFRKDDVFKTLRGWRNEVTFCNFIKKKYQNF